MEKLFTIGVYGFDAQGFFDALQTAKVDLFLDLRRRRGVRGREYAFANAGRLQTELAARDIAYRHMLALAPDEETRSLQHQADRQSKVPRRQRDALSDAFIQDYTARTLQPFAWEPLIEDVAAYRRPVLFCVERTPAACHRGLVGARLVALTGVEVENLTPS